MTVVGAALVVVLLLLAAGWARRRWMIIIVEGPSMAPTLAPGARLIVRRTGTAPLRVGDVVVAEPPLPGPPRLIVKRVVAVPGDPVPPGIVRGPADVTVPAGRYLLLGDNPADSRDSRLFGYVDAERVRGVVVRTLGR